MEKEGEDIEDHTHRQGEEERDERFAWGGENLRKPQQRRRRGQGGQKRHRHLIQKEEKPRRQEADAGGNRKPSQRELMADPRLHQEGQEDPVHHTDCRDHLRQQRQVRPARDRVGDDGVLHRTGLDQRQRGAVKDAPDVRERGDQEHGQEVASLLDHPRNGVARDRYRCQKECVTHQPQVGGKRRDAQQKRATSPAGQHP